MTSDDELIAQAVAKARAQKDAAPDLSLSALLVGSILSDENLVFAVARNLLSRDPEAVRIPMKGHVS